MRRVQMKIPKRNTMFSLVMVLFLMLCTSCATIKNAPTPPPPAATEQNSYIQDIETVIFPVKDPLEGYNRVVQDINAGITEHVASPLSEAWRWATPKFVRTGLGNFFENLTFPLRAVNHTLQGQWKFLWVDTCRFAVNTTAGGLGFWDVASGWGYPHIQGTFQHTLHQWGAPEGVWLNLPIMGPGTVRDAVGKTLDTTLNVFTWLAPTQEALICRGILNLNDLSQSDPTLAQFFQTQYNHYELTKILTVMANRAAAERYRIDWSRKDEFDVDPSFGHMRFAPKEEGFFYESRQRTAILPDGGKMPYTCWPLDGAKQIVFILPGIGGHRQSGAVSAIAEMCRNAGYAAIAVSSTFTPEYFTSLKCDAPPGYFPADAKRLGQALSAVLADYRRRYPSTGEEEYAMVGYSLGALNSLFLAAGEVNGEIAPGLKIQRYLAINPPWDVLKALGTIDQFFALPAQWPAAERQAQLKDAAMRLASFMRPNIYNPPSQVVPLTRQESQFFIGLLMRMELAAAILAYDSKNPTGLLNEQDSANRRFMAALSLGYTDYVQKVVLPWYAANGNDGGKSPQQLLNACSLPAIADALSKNPRITLFQNRNDFLLAGIPEADKNYTRIFGERAVLFDDGGHLGNMFLPQYQEAMLKALAPAAAPQP